MLSLSVVIHSLGSFRGAFDAAAAQSHAQLRDWTNAPCVDDWDRCETEAARGECAANPGFMHASCKSSCARCDIVDARTMQSYVEVALYAARNTGSAAATSAMEFLASQTDSIDPSSRKNTLRAALTILDDGKSTLRSLSAAESAVVGGGGGQSTIAASLPLRAAPNSASIPAVGFGTWKLEGSVCEEAVVHAIAEGYRHLDTAQVYGNEAALGSAVKASGVARAELFITTKLAEASFSDARAAIERSLEQLDTPYVDLLLLHGPGASAAVRLTAWRALERAYAEGLAKAIGVSNFNVAQLEELARSAVVGVAVVQNLLDPYHSGESARLVIEYCAQNKIVFVAYSTLDAWPFALRALDDAHVAAVATEAAVPPSVALLRWALQLAPGVIAVIPKASSHGHIRENSPSAVLAAPLSADALATISSLAVLSRSPWNAPPRGVYARGLLPASTSVPSSFAEGDAIAQLRAAFAAPATTATTLEGGVTVRFISPPGARFELFWLPASVVDAADFAASGVAQGTVEGSSGTVINTFVGHRFWYRRGGDAQSGSEGSGVVTIVAGALRYALGGESPGADEL